MNDEPIKESKSAGSSRLGKEAKIGVTMILALVLILGVVATFVSRGRPRTNRRFGGTSARRKTETRQREHSRGFRQIRRKKAPRRQGSEDRGAGRARIGQTARNKGA